MTKVKFEVIRDYYGQVDGYKLGDYYLMKHYSFGNYYSWIINKTGQSHYYCSEFDKAIQNGDVELVHSCKGGKQILIDRYTA